MNSFDIYNRGDCIVGVINHDFRTTDDGMYCHFTTRFLYGKVLEQGTAGHVVVAYKYTYANGDNWTRRKTPQWKKEETHNAQRIPPDCWLNDEKTAIFLKLQGLATEFGLL